MECSQHKKEIMMHLLHYRAVQTPHNKLKVVEERKRKLEQIALVEQFTGGGTASML
jgi:hypothetical protein